MNYVDPSGYMQLAAASTLAEGGYNLLVLIAGAIAALATQTGTLEYDDTISFTDAFPTTREAAKDTPITIADTRTLRPKGSTYIYRYTTTFDNRSLTPEPAGTLKPKRSGGFRKKYEDDKDLSFSTVPGTGWKTTMEKINSSLYFIAIQDRPDHVAVMPSPFAVLSGHGTMEDWVASYKNANTNPHFYTTQLHAIIGKNRYFK